MKEKTVLRWSATTCLALMSVAAFARPEPNSFLNRPANNVTQLIQQVNSDKEVADRYERHFGKDRTEIVTMFKGLHTARLSQDGVYMIYNVNDEGVIRARALHLRAGTKVFADSSNAPILKASCGNAMTNGSNAQESVLSPAMPGMTTQMHDLVATVPDPMETEAVALMPFAPSEPVALAPLAPAQITSGNNNQGIAALPAALAAVGGGAAVLLGNRGSGAVPEPATMLVLGAGALAMLRKRRQK